MPATLFQKVWDRHVLSVTNEATLLYIDRHLVHEVTSPQAFDGLRLAGRKVRRPDLTFATIDHNVPTDDQLDIRDALSRRQIETLRSNCREFGVNLYDIQSGRQGIVHVIGPELGLTLPGTTIVCGDSHTSTHGAFGALAFGIGTSEVEHVLATQTLWQGKRPAALGVEVTGTLGKGLEPKDIILAVIRAIGTAGGTGTVIEYYGPAIRALSMEGRLTICNMSIEAGARAGLIAPDDVTFAYFTKTDRPYAPKGKALDDAIADWRTLQTDPDAKFDSHVTIDASKLVPQVTWGTNPSMTVDADGRIPTLEELPASVRAEADRAFTYMGLTPGTPGGPGSTTPPTATRRCPPTATGLRRSPPGRQRPPSATTSSTPTPSAPPSSSNTRSPRRSPVGGRGRRRPVGSGPSSSAAQQPSWQPAGPSCSR